MFWSNPKDVDTKDRYGVTIDPKWLLDETIVSAQFIPDTSSGLIMSDHYIDQNTYSVMFEGGIAGFHKVHVRINTESRSLERCLYLWVNQCEV